MSLPTRTAKHYPTKIISSGKDVLYCRMNLRQQKSILLLEMEDNKEIRQQKALITIMNECVEGCDVQNLYKTDFQKLVFDVRSSSDGNIIKFTYNNVKFEDNNGKLFGYDDIVTDSAMIGIESKDRMARIRELLSAYKRIVHENNFELNIRADVELTKGVFEKEETFGEWKVFLKAPTVKMIQMVDEMNTKDEAKELYKRMLCLSHVATDKETFSEFTFDELVGFFDENITSEEFDKVIAFYDQIPKLVLNKDFKCEKWGDVLLEKGKEITDFL